MAYFHPPAYPYTVEQPSSFEEYTQQMERQSTLNLDDRFYHASLYAVLPQQQPVLNIDNQFYHASLLPGFPPSLSPARRAQSPPVSTSNISYSLANAMIPVEEPRPTPTPPHHDPPTQRPETKLFVHDKSSKGSIYDPGDDASSLSSLSPSPSPPRAVKKEHTATTRARESNGTGSQTKKSRRAALVRVSRGHKAKGVRTPEDDDIPPQTVRASPTVRT